MFINNLPNQELFILIAISILLVVLVGLFVFIFLQTRQAAFGLRAKLKSLNKYRLFFLLIVLDLILIVYGIGYLTKLESDPIKVVTAKEFFSIKTNSLAKLQSQGYGSWGDAKLLMIDLRGKKAFDAEHVKGSGELTPEQVSKDVVPGNGVSIALVVSKTDLKKAKDLATLLSKKVVLTDDGKPTEVIYVISDGFEGLKESGLALEKGGWD